MSRWRRIARPLAVALVVAVALVAVLVPLLVEARPGGGQSYGGGGGGGGSGGGGGGGDVGELFGLLIWLAFEQPVIGVPLLVVVAVIYARARRGTPADWDAGGGGLGFDSGPGAGRRAPRARLGDLRRIDPDFSVVLFEDFVYRLYASAQEARSDPDRLAELAPYLDASVRHTLAQAAAADDGGGAPVANVVIGAMRVLKLEIPGVQQVTHPHPITGEPQVEVELEFEANYTVGAGADARGFYVWERWLLRRPVSVTTPEPERARSLACPSCGAPFRSADMQRCEYCGEVVTDGRFGWLVVGSGVVRREQKPPALTADVGEAGTDLPTVYAPDLRESWAALAADDPASHPGAIEARLQLIYRSLNAAWTARNLAAVRGFLSDGMADYLRYWIESYEREGLINELDDMRITRLELAKVVRDRWYDAITYRVWATGRDFTVREADKTIVSGHPRRERVYSEYWTLIRAAGIRGAPRADHGCPNCGAPLELGMGGTCRHCGAHVTSGEFDWVLSKIEQDEVYGG